MNHTAHYDQRQAQSRQLLADMTALYRLRLDHSNGNDKDAYLSVLGKCGETLLSASDGSPDDAFLVTLELLIFAVQRMAQDGEVK